MEFLEHRRVLTTTYAVDTVLDVEDPNDGFTSLREAVNAANSNGNDNEFDIINLEPGLTYELTNGPLDIEASLRLFGGRMTANGPLTTIDGKGLDRLFNVQDGRQIPGESLHYRNDVTFTDLRLTGGVANEGAAVWNSGTLTFVGSELEGNQATGTEEPAESSGNAALDDWRRSRGR